MRFISTNWISKCAAFLLCIFVLKPFDGLNAQTKPSLDRSLLKMAFELDTGREPSFTQETDGSLKFLLVSRQKQDHIGLLHLFESSEFLAELDVTHGQREKVDLAIKKWRQDYSETWKEIWRTDEYGKHRVLGKKMRETLFQVGIDGQKSVFRHLSKFQKKRVYQLQFRFLVRAFGLSKVLKADACRAIPSLDPRDIREFQQVSKIDSEFIAKELIEIRDAARKVLLKPLSKKQNEKFQEKWSYLFQDRTPIDRFRFHLIFIDPFKKLEEISNPFIRLNRFPIFFVSPGGRVRTICQAKSYLPAMEKYEIGYVRWKILVGRTKDKFDLSDSQVSFLKKLPKQWEANFKTGMVEKKSLNQIWDEGAKLYSDGIKKELLQVQLDKLESMPETLLEMKYGPVYDLVHGRLGKEMKLSQTVKDSLRKSATLAKDLLEKKLILLEEKWYKKLISNLPPLQQKKFRKLIGRRLRFTPPVVVLLFSER